MALRLELAGHAAYSLTAVQGPLSIGTPVASCCREVGNVAPGAVTCLQRLLCDQLQFDNKLVCVLTDSNRSSAVQEILGKHLHGACCVLVQAPCGTLVRQLFPKQ